MELVVTATEARIRFGEMIRRVVDEQQAIIVERGGKPQIVMLSITQYERLKAVEQKQTPWQERVRQVRARIAAELGDRELPPAEEIIRQTKEEWVRLFR